MNKIQKINETIIDSTIDQDTFDFNDLSFNDSKPDVFDDSPADTPLSKSLARSVTYEDPMKSGFFDRLPTEN